MKRLQQCVWSLETGAFCAAHVYEFWQNSVKDSTESQLIHKPINRVKLLTSVIESANTERLREIKKKKQIQKENGESKENDKQQQGWVRVSHTAHGQERLDPNTSSGFKLLTCEKQIKTAGFVKKKKYKWASEENKDLFPISNQIYKQTQRNTWQETKFIRKTKQFLTYSLSSGNQQPIEGWRASWKKDQ